MRAPVCRVHSWSLTSSVCIRKISAAYTSLETFGCFLVASSPWADSSAGLLSANRKFCWECQQLVITLSDLMGVGYVLRPEHVEGVRRLRWR